MSKKVIIPYVLLIASVVMQSAAGVYKFISGMNGTMEMCSAVIFMIYAFTLKPDPAKKMNLYHYFAAPILFYISLAELVWYVFGSGNTVGIIIMIPLVISGAYCIWKTVLQYRELCCKKNDSEN